jgi:hypothetical protein
VKRLKALITPDIYRNRQTLQGCPSPREGTGKSRFPDRPRFVQYCANGFLGAITIECLAECSVACTALLNPKGELRSSCGKADSAGLLEGIDDETDG